MKIKTKKDSPNPIKPQKSTNYATNNFVDKYRLKINIIDPKYIFSEF